MRIKNFNLELFYFLNFIKNNINFSLSRWGDGELTIIENNFIDLRNLKNGEFRYDPNISEYSKPRQFLMDSFTYNDENYYIGIACPCCVGVEKYQYMKKISNQNEDNLTWANIFVNSNYENFMIFFTEEFKNHTINIVVNKQSDITKLPFKIKNVYYIGTDAWLNDLNIIDDIKENMSENEIYLFAAGPLSNILTYELWKYNNKNTYIDIGSVYDKIMGMKATRGYLLGADTLKKKCIW